MSVCSQNYQREEHCAQVFRVYHYGKYKPMLHNGALQLDKVVVNNPHVTPFGENEIFNEIFGSSDHIRANFFVN